jgi:hypothetical protein
MAARITDKGKSWALRLTALHGKFLDVRATSKAQAHCACRGDVCVKKKSGNRGLDGKPSGIFAALYETVPPIPGTALCA